MKARTRRGPRLLVTVAVSALAVSALTLVGGTGAAGAAKGDDMVVKVPKGAAKPVAGTGIGTAAAMDDPRCNTEARFGPYGRWDTSLVGAGPACVRPFAEGEKNGGATATGVTADSVKVVAVLPAAQHLSHQNSAAPPRYYADDTTSTLENAVHDFLFAYKDFYEQWGRSIDVTFYTATGIDEAAQRADFVAISAMKPFAVMNFDSYGGDVLMSQLAQEKILVNGFLTSKGESESLAPYRWMAGIDADAAATSAAEAIGKNLVGKKAEFGGDDVKDQTRKFGLVTIEDQVDLDGFKSLLGDYKGTIAVESSYPGQGDALGDPVVAQEQAPTMVQRMKDGGVTTVVLVADRAMNQALMENAESQDWHPEWFFTATGYTDLPVLAAGLPETQSEHAFGISIIGPYFETPPELVDFFPPEGAYNWFWGKGQGSNSGVLSGSTWILAGIHYAGPKLTVKTFRQGLFSAPPTGGDPKNPLSPLNGYGRTTGLPYDAYTSGPADFAPFFMDPYTTAISPGTATETEHASWYMNDARRYGAGQWPKNIKWFDKSISINVRDSYPAGVPLPEPAPPCAQGMCPSTGATEPTTGADAGSTFSIPPTPGAVGSTAS